MPKRIPFHIVYATSEDSNYPACELNSHGPASRGWRSSGQPPHELLLRLTSIASVHKLQLLAHHQLVPAWVEVLVSGGLVSEGGTTPCGAVYNSVGKVALAKPQPQARTRELRSAALPQPTVARFVKLRLSGPHLPGLENDQIALMAVNVLGEEVEDQPAPASPSSQTEPTYCPYDDLAFVMYVDNDIADLVRKLDGRKKIAVIEERFEYARRLKSAGSALASAGIRIGRWRLRKRIAASRDDFELARRMRDRIADALIAIKEDNELCQLFEDDGPNPKNDSSMPQEYDFSHHLSPSVVAGALSFDIPSPVPPDPGLDVEDKEELDGTEDINGAEEIIRDEIEYKPEPVQVHEIAQVEELPRKQEDDTRRETDSPRRSVTPNAANGGVLVRRRNKSAGPRSTFEAYEERLLPALRHSHTNEYLKESREDEGSGTGSTGQLKPTYKLNERERKHAALPILIFGYPLVEKFYSKTFLDKEEGLACLRSELTSSTEGNTKTSPNKTARAAAVLLQRSLRDKVFSVYSQANEVVRTLFQEYMPNRVCAAEVGRCLEKLLPELLRACGDPAPRIHSTAQHTVLTVADCIHVRSLHIIPQQLVRPVNAAMHPRLALSRLQMLEQLLLSHGINTDKNSGLTVRRLAECGASGAQHASGAVRAAAERILLAAYNRSPRVVRAQLPPDDAVTRRNLIYRHLFQQFDKIDMQKMLNQAPTEDQILNGVQSTTESLIETSSLTTTRSGLTVSGMTSSLGATYSIKSLSTASGVTLAPSSLSGSYTTSKTRSSLKKSSPMKRYTPTKKEFANNLGYNKLRLDSAVSPKHSPRSSACVEKVHFQENQKSEVVYRRTNRNSENRHSMIHYDHDTSKPQLKERPVTVYEPLHLDYRDSPCLGSPKNSKNNFSLDSLNMESPQASRDDLRCLDSPKLKSDYFKDSPLDSPRISAGLRNLQLDENREMDESGYYSPGDTRGRNQSLRSKGMVAEFCDQHFDSFEGAADVSSEGNTPEPVCNIQCTWCGRWVSGGGVGLDNHCWRHCVILARCNHCQQLIEARALHTHLLQQCPTGASAWKQCNKCGAALRVEASDYHPHCIPLGPDEWKCPYCYNNILARELPWQRHLMQCPRNPRVSSRNL